MKFRELEHGTVPLDGMHLVEASAGTGKTWAIASLYLRLLLEKNLNPEEILVVTYTEAATRELRGRIRNRVREALAVLRGEPAGDAFLQDLHARLLAEGRIPEAETRLAAALASFDAVAIFTIHGFCLRALQDHAFASGSLYDTELVKDQLPLFREVADDFWRRHFFRQESPLLAYAVRKGLTADGCMKLLQELHVSGFATVLPDYPAAAVEQIESDCRAAFDTVCGIWNAERGGIVSILENDKGLRRTRETYRQDMLSGIIEQIDAFTAQRNPFDLFKKFELLTASGICQQTKPSGSPPEHPFFDACNRLQVAVDERLLALKSELWRFWKEQVPTRKRQQNVRFFDDLLADLRAALCDVRHGGAFALLLREKYRAALIDEFQDTDPVQYDIFRTIYHGSGLPLFLIGDPKQAIYSFRGADVFAYLQAVEDVGAEGRFTLTSNWRSDPDLLKAFNLLFDQGRQPFLFTGIAYHPLHSGRSEGTSAAADVTQRRPPLEIRHLAASGATGGMITAGKAVQLAAVACADGIAEMLGGNGEEPECSSASDIAVIVRTHRQARMVLDALKQRGIAAVMRSDESVFGSREAEEVLLLVSAIAEPGREALVKAAHATEIMGWTAADIARADADESVLVDCLRRFRDYHQVWQEQGFMVMARRLLLQEKVRQRMLAAPGLEGDRRLTNLLHCFELLHRAAHEQGLGMEGLVSWFGERVTTKEPGEAFQIRLESDEPAVRIVTIHVSKGLEYPVVFCPFMFGGIPAQGEVVLCHDDSGRQVMDFGSDRMAEHRCRSEREAMAENLRLLYVALTRAKHRCIVFTADVPERRGLPNPSPALSALSWLLFVDEQAKTGADPVGSARASLAAIGLPAMEKGFLELAAQSGGTIGYRRVETSGATVSPAIPVMARSRPTGGHAARRFTGQIASDWGIASFTSFSRNRKKHAELPDRDEASDVPLLQPMPVEEEAGGIASFERGARAGILMHALFENLDYAALSTQAIRELVLRELQRQGFGESWEPCLSEMVSNMVSTRIITPAGTFRLDGLARGAWATELEFYLPLKLLTGKQLGELFAGCAAISGAADDLANLAESLEFRPVEGLLMGFIDMALYADGKFWLIDWKSNHLGSTPGDYTAPALRAAMLEHRYTLQYLLYTVAFDRYLARRVPGYSYDSHFGGVVYAFLRGISPEPDDQNGLFYARPERELVSRLGALMLETDKEIA